MKDQLKWVLNHMPKSDDQHLDVMSLPNVAKARSFHGSFPQYSITPLAQLDGMAQYLGLAGVYVRMSPTGLVSTPSRCWAAPSPWPGTSPARWAGTCPK